jgi:hypothetical protein
MRNGILTFEATVRAVECAVHVGKADVLGQLGAQDRSAFPVLILPRCNRLRMASTLSPHV